MQSHGAGAGDIEATTAPPQPLWQPVLRAGLLLCGLLAAGLLIAALPGFDHAVLKSSLLRDGIRGRIVFLCIGTLVCAVGLPRQAVGFAAGFAYGPVIGVLLATAANLAAGVIDLLWARIVAREWARARAQRWAAGGMRRGRMARLDGFISANPFTAILTLRLLPVGSSLLVSLLAGVLGVRLLPFVGATLLGGLPQTVIFVLVGSGARIGQPIQIALGVALGVASAILGGILLRRTVSLSSEPDRAPAAPGEPDRAPAARGESDRAPAARGAANRPGSKK